MNAIFRLAFAKTSLWVTGILASLLLLAAVLSQLDWQVFTRMARNVDTSLLLLSLLLLFIEGAATALRLRWFAADRPGILPALQANAWYAVLIVLLPARLGEVAAVLVLEKYLGQTRGGALMSIIAQRLFDLLVLSALFLLALITASDILPWSMTGLVAVLVIAGAWLAILRMECFLALAGTAILRTGKARKPSLKRSVLRVLLQARTWRRHAYNRSLGRGALLLTILKWSATLGAISLLFTNLYPPMGLSSALLASTAYNFVAVIPIQTIGGLGVGEAGLAAILFGMGIALPTAVAISLFARLVLILFPFLFLAAVFIIARLRGANRAWPMQPPG